MQGALLVAGTGSDVGKSVLVAAMYGTLALLPPADQALVAGFVINKFRGAHELLRGGLAMLRELTGRPVYGVLPWREGLQGDAEDSLALDACPGPRHAGERRVPARVPERGRSPGRPGVRARAGHRFRRAARGAA